MQENIAKPSKERKGVSLTTVSYFILSAVFLFAILTLWGIKNVATRFMEMQTSSKAYEDTRNDIDTMMAGSDYLTEQVRFFVITGDRRYMDNYFYEANQTKRRDKAVSNIISKLDLNVDTKVALQDALNESNELMKEEFHAMKIVSHLHGLSPESLPKEILDWPLTSEELLLSHEELKERAYYLVFGNVYIDYKDRIRASSRQSLDSVEKATHENFDVSSARLRNIITLHVFLTIVLLLFAAILVVIIFVFVVRPLKLYDENIARDEPLHITGSKEFRRLAQTYNKILAQNIERQNHLSFIAEHDGLTKVYNRVAFEKISSQMQGQKLSLCLLIIDVDKFKDINDTYGHAVGDQALYRTAKVFRSTFRSGDYCFRYGGDEFVVLITDILQNKKDALVKKLSIIFNILQTPEEDFPKVSLSVGLAFSENGYSPELLNQADTALYHTKEKGRGGYTFFNEGLLEYKKF